MGRILEVRGYINMIYQSIKTGPMVLFIMMSEYGSWKIAAFENAH